MRKAVKASKATRHASDFCGVYVQPDLADERIIMDDCGCVYSWRRVPRIERSRYLFECSDVSDGCPRNLWQYAVHVATYQNEELEQAIRWQ